MPQVGPDNEALYERAAFVYTGSLWVPLKSDASGQLAVGVIAGQSLQANMAGYFGSAYQKQNMLLGYAGTISEDLSDLDLAAGTTELDGTAVPANQVWVITAAAVRCTSAVATFVRVGCTVGGVSVFLADQATPVSGKWYGGLGQMVMAPGDYVLALITGAALHDQLFFRYLGYKFYTNL